jgi:hypothetical protein
MEVGYGSFIALSEIGNLFEAHVMCGDASWRS